MPLLKDFGSAPGSRAAVTVGKALRTAFEKGNPGGDGSYIEAELSTTATEVEHTLGSIPKGWLVIDRDADESVYRSAESTATHVTLTASGDVNVVLWVF